MSGVREQMEGVGTTEIKGEAHRADGQGSEAVVRGVVKWRVRAVAVAE